MILWALIIITGLFLFSFIRFCILAATYRVYIRDRQTITYDEFIKISAIAPDKWYITTWQDYYCACYDCTDIFMKNYCDMKKLGFLLQKQRRQRNEAELNKRKAELIKKWQKDINDCHDEYVDYVKIYFGNGKKL